MISQPHLIVPISIVIYVFVSVKVKLHVSLSSLFEWRAQIRVGWGHDTFGVVSDFDLVVPILVMVYELICIKIKLNIFVGFLDEGRNVISSVNLMAVLDWSQFWVGRSDDAISVVAKFDLVIPIFIMVHELVSIMIKLNVFFAFGHEA